MERQQQFCASDIGYDPNDWRMPMMVYQHGHGGDQPQLQSQQEFAIDNATDTEFEHTLAPPCSPLPFILSTTPPSTPSSMMTEIGTENFGNDDSNEYYDSSVTADLNQWTQSVLYWLMPSESCPPQQEHSDSELLWPQPMSTSTEDCHIDQHGRPMTSFSPMTSNAIYEKLATPTPSYVLQYTNFISQDNPYFTGDKVDLEGNGYARNSANGGQDVPNIHNHNPNTDSSHVAQLESFSSSSVTDYNEYNFNLTGIDKYVPSESTLPSSYWPSCIPEDLQHDMYSLQDASEEEWYSTSKFYTPVPGPGILTHGTDEMYAY